MFWDNGRWFSSRRVHWDISGRIVSLAYGHLLQWDCPSQEVIWGVTWGTWVSPARRLTGNKGKTHKKVGGGIEWWSVETKVYGGRHLVYGAIRGVRDLGKQQIVLIVLVWTLLSPLVSCLSKSVWTASEGTGMTLRRTEA